MGDGLRILVADDDVVIQDWYRKVLSMQGHEVVGVARTGRELMNLYAMTKPDLVITDIMMPDIDGITAAHRMYDQRPAPIVLVSGHMDEDVIERAASLRIAAVLVKPIAATTIKVQIQLAMRRFLEYQSLIEKLNEAGDPSTHR